VSELFGQLKPYDPKGGEDGSSLLDWFGTGFATLVLVFLGGALSVPCWYPASRHFKTLREVSKTGDLDGYETQASGNCEEDGA
jgi:hypothetical protein